jgi:hypothetical protein
MKFFVDELPESVTVMSFIRQTPRWQAALEKVASYKYDDFVADVSQTRIQQLESGIRDLSTTIPFKSWINKEGKQGSYLGASITYNPNHIENLDINYSTLGSRLNSSNEFFWNVKKNHTILKNSYFDTYGFKKLTPFGELINGIIPIASLPGGISLIRSRIGVIDASKPQSKNYHKDEIVYENLRLNIPVWSESNTFVFQKELETPYRLEVGKCYSWDTNIAHGVFSTEIMDATRCNIVLGFSPWLSYNEQENSWSTNDFFGVPAAEIIPEIYKSLHLNR